MAKPEGDDRWAGDWVTYTPASALRRPRGLVRAMVEDLGRSPENPYWFQAPGVQASRLLGGIWVALSAVLTLPSRLAITTHCSAEEPWGLIPTMKGMGEVLVGSPW